MIHSTSVLAYWQVMDLNNTFLDSQDNVSVLQCIFCRLHITKDTD